MGKRIKLSKDELQSLHLYPIDSGPDPIQSVNSRITSQTNQQAHVDLHSGKVVIKLTEPQRQLLRLLADGLPHRCEEVQERVDNHSKVIHSIVPILALKGEDIIVQLIGELPYFRLIGFCKQGREGCSYWLYEEFVSTVMERDKGRCQKCGGQATVVHHIQPWRDNFDLRFEPSNGQSLCRSCHAKCRPR